MRGTVQIKAGHYAISDAVSLDIAASDDGVVISMSYLLVKKRLTVVVNEHGSIVRRRDADCPTAPALHPSLSSVAVPPAERPAAALPPAGGRLKQPKQIKFVIKYGKGHKPRNVAYVVGGFAGNGSIHILYRIRSGGTAVTKGQLHLHGYNHVALRNGIPPKYQLPPERWDAFLAMPDNSFFDLTKVWRKMSREEIKVVVEGKTFSPRFEIDGT